LVFDCFFTLCVSGKRCTDVRFRNHIFGWPSLYVALVREGVFYSNQCVNCIWFHRRMRQSESSIEFYLHSICVHSRRFAFLSLWLARIFQRFCEFCCVVMFMGWGILLDRYGPRKTIALASSLFMIA
jgi:hypothetical protein